MHRQLQFLEEDFTAVERTCNAEAPQALLDMVLASFIVEVLHACLAAELHVIEVLI